MNIRSRTEREIVRNIDSMSLQDIILSSPASRAETNMILAQIINQNHHLNTRRMASTYSPIVMISAAA